MTADEFKRLIEQQAGVPAALLDGNTPEEILATARKLVEYRSRNEAQRRKSNAERFGDWFRVQMNEEEPKNEAGAALDEIEEALRRARGGYPAVRDQSSDPGDLPDARPAREQFAEWFSGKTAFDPFKDPDGWKGIF